MTAWRDGTGSGELTAKSTIARTMVNGSTLFNSTGDIKIMDLHGECISANDATASTVQIQSAPTGLVASTISGASATLASAIVGTVVALDGTALTTAPNIYPNGAGAGMVARGIIHPSGAIKTVVGVGPTTGTWVWYITYIPLEPGATVVGV